VLNVIADGYVPAELDIDGHDVIELEFIKSVTNASIYELLKLIFYTDAAVIEAVVFVSDMLLFPLVMFVIPDIPFEDIANGTVLVSNDPVRVILIDPPVCNTRLFAVVRFTPSKLLFSIAVQFDRE
jgi:hypothetical protein